MGSSILTVGETKGFADLGGVINLTVKENRLRFDQLGCRYLNAAENQLQASAAGQNCQGGTDPMNPQTLRSHLSMSLQFTGGAVVAGCPMASRFVAIASFGAARWCWSSETARPKQKAGLGPHGHEPGRPDGRSGESVPNKEQRLSETPAAIYMITLEDMRRAGVTSVPLLLRMVPPAGGAD